MEDYAKHKSEVAVTALTAAGQGGGSSSSSNAAQDAQLDRLESDMAEIKTLLLNLQPLVSHSDAGGAAAIAAGAGVGVAATDHGHLAASDV